MKDWEVGEIPSLDQLIEAIERRGYCHKCLMAFNRWRSLADCRYRLVQFQAWLRDS